MGFLDLEKHFVFYGTYHRDPTNVMIHIIFVPALMFTMMLWTANVRLAPDSVTTSPYANLSTLTATAYAVLYALLEPMAGTLLAPYVVAQSLVGTYLVERFGNDANKIAGIVQLFSWVCQFIGHGVYEKRAPALLDNLVQALFLAPLFVWLEVLFMFGYRPEFQRRMHEKMRLARSQLDAAATEKVGVKGEKKGP